MFNARHENLNQGDKGETLQRVSVEENCGNLFMLFFVYSSVVSRSEILKLFVGPLACTISVGFRESGIQGRRIGSNKE